MVVSSSLLITLCLLVVQGCIEDSTIISEATTQEVKMKSRKVYHKHLPHLLYTLFLLVCPQGSDGLRVREVVVPPHSSKGAQVELECLYDLGEDQLYSVKWYKGFREFFRYVPVDSPPIQVFELPGVNVDVDHSSSRRVVLREVTLRTSGRYKCEVSAEAPSFHTDFGTGELLVVHVPELAPQISGMRNKYYVGDPVQVNCTSSPSKPAASLMWYINGQQANSDFVMEHAPVPTNEGLEKSILGLHFRATLDHLKSGRLELRCSATIAAVYYRETTSRARGRLTERVHVPERRGMFSGVECCSVAGVWCMLMGVCVGVAILR